MTNTYDLVLGNGGIGYAVMDHLQQQGRQVEIVSRQKGWSLETLPQLFENGLPERIINNIGFLHDDQHHPEKHSKHITQAHLQHSIDINVWPTIAVIQALTPYLTRQTHLKFLVISARVGSISDNQLGGWYSYRMSKAALNMLVKNAAIEWSRHAPKAIIAAYQPGTVDTPLSKPFQRQVAPGKLFAPEQAAQYLLDVLDTLSFEQSGQLIDWQGKQISP